MFPQPFIPGYLFYLLEVFIPGLGLGELLGAWTKEDILVDKVSLAFGLGLAFDTLALVIRTSGLRIAGAALLGMDTTTIGTVILMGLLFLAAALIRKRRFDFPRRPVTLDGTVFLLVVAQAAMILLWFEKYPIFPAFYSPDPAIHVQLTQDLISGYGRSIPQGLFYFGEHLQLASALLLIGGEALVTVQRTIAVLAALSPVLIYTATSRLFSSIKAGLVTTLVYSLSGTLWFNSVFTTGLYPNFFGIVSTLFFLVAYIELARNSKSVRSWATFILALLMLYFSHYTSVTVLPALLVVGLFKLVGKKPDAKAYLFPSLASVAPGLIGYVLFPSYFQRLFASLLSAPGTVVGGTALSGLFSSIPVLSDMALEVSDDVAFILLLVLVVVYVYRVAILRRVAYVLPLAWLIPLALVSVYSASPQRFAFAALVPMTLMAGYGFSTLIPKIEARRMKGRRIRSRGGQPTKPALVLAILLIPLVANSWGQYLLTDSTNNTQLSAQTQQSVYSAMYWLKDNTPSGSYYSVTDWEFIYTSMFFGRATTFSYFPDPSQVVTAARSSGAKYVIVTYYTTIQLPANPKLQPWNTFGQDANLSLAYSNDDVKIFRII